MGKTELIIVGGGAAGLMAACAAGELGLHAVVVERKHKPGRKLLMCGNGRCNLTTNIAAARMVEMFGDPVGPFLSTAIHAFDPSALQRWFAARGLPTAVRAGNKVYPRSDCAGDVLNFFTDRLRDLEVPVACPAPVEALERWGHGYRVTTRNFELEAPHVLVATGGVSYPKTGSVGDGQEWARKLGHTVSAFRPGLVGFEVAPAAIRGRVGEAHERVAVDVLCEGRKIAETRGVFEIEKWGIGGTAITDASRILARNKPGSCALVVHRPDGQAEIFEPLRSRPLKEAMVTIGGIALDEIDPATMESRLCRGLYLAGEVLDIDGPTGGYNLQAAFSTARLAVAAIGRRCGRKGHAEDGKPAASRRRPGKGSG